LSLVLVLLLLSPEAMCLCESFPRGRPRH